jgi:hypothetical protein
MDNNHLIVLIFIVLLLLSLCADYMTKFFFKNKLKYIEEIFGPEGFITVDNKMKGEKYNLTYGELTGEGMNKIVKFLESKNIKPSNSTFIDLGCGNGKTLAYATVYGFKQARGAEIVEARYEYAEKKRALLEERMRERITISKSDIFNLPKNYFPSNSVIFVSNLLFPEPTNQELINYLSANTPADSIIIVSKVPPNLYKLKLIEKIHVPMSWASNSECYILSH